MELDEFGDGGEGLAAERGWAAGKSVAMSSLERGILDEVERSGGGGFEVGGELAVLGELDERGRAGLGAGEGLDGFRRGPCRHWAR